MVWIVGNVKAEDDYTHPLGSEANFNESVYFNFFDPAQQRGGFLRIGNRANEGYAELTVIVYNPDGSAFFNYKKPEIDHNDGWHAGGLRVDVTTPGEELRTRYEGSALFMTDPRAMQDPGKAFKANPFRRLELDLTHRAVGPLFGHVGEPGDGNEFARAHYEQHMRVTGTLAVEGETPLAVNGHGLRDHSWGPRYWQSIRSYRWITGNFGDDLGMVLSVIGERRGGMVYKNGRFLKVTALDLETDYEPDTGFHRALTAQLTLENGDRHHVAGTVRGYIPLRNRRSEQVTYIGEGMTGFVMDGVHHGAGLSEYLNQPGDDVA